MQQLKFSKKLIEWTKILKNLDTVETTEVI